MKNIVYLSIIVCLSCVLLSDAQEKQISCDSFGYELIATRLDALENIVTRSQLSSTGDGQNIRKDIQELTRNRLPRSCSDVVSKSGIYRLDVSRGIKAPFEVYCDQDFEGGGWLVFQNRFNGAGIDSMVLEGFDGDKATARYSDFAIGSESEFYVLNKLGTYSGTANDSLTYHLNGRFSTFDRDNDEHNTNCALTYFGAWWYKACHHSNLNARYDPNGSPNKIVVWRKWKDDSYALKRTRMMIRRKALQ